MKADKININALKFGIMCNCTPFCGEERARESVELIMELERLAKIGEATEKAYKCGFKMTKGQEITDGFRYEYVRDDEFETIEELLALVESED